MRRSRVTSRAFVALAVLPLLALAAAPAQTPSPDATPVETPQPFSEGPLTIGHSVQGRPIEVWRFGSGERAYLVVGGIHGGYEVNTSRLLYELIATIEKHPEEFPADVTLYLLPVLNPDGAQFPDQKEGRANANGVDLNRNYPNPDWATTWPKSGCWNYLPIHGGEYALSEPETAALMAFVIENRPLTALLSYHAAAPGFYPALDDASESLSAYLSEASGYPYPPPFTGCHMTGSLADWAAGQGVPAIDVELPNHRDTDFETNWTLIQALLRWTPESAATATPEP